MSRRRRRLVLVASVVGCAVGVGALARVAADGPEPVAAPKVSTGTAEVVRGDLSVSETLDGTLGFAGERRVVSSRAGVVTRTPRPGRVVRRGDLVVGIDEEPVVLLYGSTPAYRDLQVGDEGTDVLQLERNLRAMGYDEGLEVDGEFTSWTAYQVRQWQEELGSPETGTVGMSSVVFLPGAQRVSSLAAEVGTSVQPGMPLMTVSSVAQVVTVALPVDQRDLVEPGLRVEVVVPTGERVRGSVSRIGTVVTRPQDEDGDATVRVVVRLKRTAGAGLDAAPVEVLVESERRTGVLSVPVAALLSRGAGSYFVEVRDGKGWTRVDVELGIFSDGRVEVEGTGLAAGQLVKVPA